MSLKLLDKQKCFKIDYHLIQFSWVCDEINHTDVRFGILTTKLTYIIIQKHFHILYRRYNFLWWTYNYRILFSHSHIANIKHNVLTYRVCVRDGSENPSPFFNGLDCNEQPDPEFTEGHAQMIKKNTITYIYSLTKTLSLRFVKTKK